MTKHTEDWHADSDVDVAHSLDVICDYVADVVTDVDAAAAIAGISATVSVYEKHPCNLHMKLYRASI